MKRPLVVSALVSLLCLMLCPLLAAQLRSAKNHEPAAVRDKDLYKVVNPARDVEPATAIKDQWTTVTLKKNNKKQIKVLRLFDKVTTCPNPEPERAVLRLGSVEFGEFTRDAAGFVNTWGVFSCMVGPKKLEHAVRKNPPLKMLRPASRGGDPDVMVVHDPDCGGIWYEGAVNN